MLLSLGLLPDDTGSGKCKETISTRSVTSEYSMRPGSGQYDRTEGRIARPAAVVLPDRPGWYNVRPVR